MRSHYQRSQKHTPWHTNFPEYDRLRTQLITFKVYAGNSITKGWCEIDKIYGHVLYFFEYIYIPLKHLCYGNLKKSYYSLTSLFSILPVLSFLKFKLKTIFWCLQHAPTEAGYQYQNSICSNRNRLYVPK